VTDPVALPSISLDPDAGRLDALRRAPEAQGRVRAVKELEVVLFAQMLAAMRKTIPENDLLPRSPSRDVYDGAFDRAVAEKLAENDPLGLTRTLGQELLKSRVEAADSSDGKKGVEANTP
jgi:Rod binding domain-containing protein